MYIMCVYVCNVCLCSQVQLLFTRTQDGVVGDCRPVQRLCARFEDVLRNELKLGWTGKVPSFWPVVLKISRKQAIEYINRWVWSIANVNCEKKIYFTYNVHVQLQYDCTCMCLCLLNFFIHNNYDVYFYIEIIHIPYLSPPSFLLLFFSLLLSSSLPSPLLSLFLTLSLPPPLPPVFNMLKQTMVDVGPGSG